MDRRAFLKVAAVSAAGVFIPVRMGATRDAEAETDARFVRRDDVRPGSWVTPNERFYVQDITNGNPPKVDETRWRFIISGLVKKPKILYYRDILAIDPVTTYRTLSCIGDPIGGPQIGNAEWTGVPLSALLNQATPREQATRVVFRCADGYHTAIPIEDAMHPDAILAYRMNGEPLPRAHGFPARFLNPGKYGQKCPKWIINAELVAKEYLGYWETRGWSDQATIHMTTRIHLPAHDAALTPGTYVISGSAFDGGNGGGIAAVEVSTDGGGTWRPATIWANGGPRTWALWEYRWEVSERPHSVKILARAINRQGVTQSAKSSDPFPSGATGYHAVEVDITS